MESGESQRLELQYDEEKKYGYFPVHTYLEQLKLRSVYDSDYFEKYVGYERTSFSDSLLKARVKFVEDQIGDSVLGLDMGIGSGAFLKYKPLWVGYDVNPAAINWLVEQNSYVDPYAIDISMMGIEAITFWDVFEHVDNLEKLMSRLPSWVFISIPIFESKVEVLSSKHFRKDEHYHYFSESALLDFFKTHGYDVIDKSDFETTLGRESIKSFAFNKS